MAFSPKIIDAGLIVLGNTTIRDNTYLGLTTTAGTNRIVQAQGSGADIDITLTPKGIGTLIISSPIIVGSLAADPSNINGKIYYNTATNKFKAYENGAWVNIIGGGSAQPFADNLALVKNNADNTKLAIFSASTITTATTRTFTLPNSDGIMVITSAVTLNAVPFMPSAGSIPLLTQSSSFTFDVTNLALTVGVATIHSRGTNNFFVGQSAGNFTLSGSANTGMGAATLTALTTGIGNTGNGQATLFANTTGGSNTASGNLALTTNIIGSSSSAFGANALQLSTGSQNSAFGASAGDNITTGTQNLILGFNIDAPSATANGQLSIQNAIFGTGNTGTGITVSTGNIGIYTPAPTARLHLPSGIAAAGNAPLKFVSGTALTVAEDGAFEYHTSHLYFTIGSTRYQLDQQTSGLYWLLTGTSTLTGVATITSNTGNQHIFNGTWTGVADNDYHLRISPTLTGLGTVNTHRIIGFQLSPSITAGTTSTQQLVSFYNAPTLAPNGTSSSMYLQYNTSSFAGGLRALFNNTSNNASATTLFQLMNDATRTGNIQLNSSTNAGLGGASSFNINTSANDVPLVLGSNGTVRHIIGGTGLISFTNSPTTFSSDWITFTQSAGVGGGVARLSLMVINGGAHTNLLASTEATDINFNLARTVEFATGALTTQRAFRIQAPTYSFVGASVITTAATLAISGPPVAGTNATFTNPVSLLIETGNLRMTGGFILVGNSAGDVPTTSTRLDVRGTGTASNIAIRVANSSNQVLMTMLDNGIFQLSQAGATRFTHSAVGTTITEATQAGNTDLLTLTGAAHTGGIHKAFSVILGASSGATASTENTDIDLNLARVLTWATGAITTQRAARIQAPTYAFVAASVITTAATLAISGAPIAGTNATITNSYALFVEGGESRFSGDVRIGASALFRLNESFQQYNGNNYEFRFSISSGAGSGLRLFNNNSLIGTTGTLSELAINSANVTYSSGTQTYQTILLAPIYNTTATYVGTARGIYYNPTLTSTIGLTHYAFHSTSGQILLGNTSADVISSNVRLDVRGSGTAASNWSLRLADSANVMTFLFGNSGELWLGNQGRAQLGATANGTTITNSGSSHHTLFFNTASAVLSDVPLFSFALGASINAASGNRFLIGSIPAGVIFNPTTGTANFTYLNVAPTINTTAAYVGNVYGIDYNPTLTAIVGATHIAWRNTTGQFVINRTIPASSTALTVDNNGVYTRIISLQTSGTEVWTMVGAALTHTANHTTFVGTGHNLVNSSSSNSANSVTGLSLSGTGTMGASFTGNYINIGITPTYNTNAAGTGQIIGIFYNPTLASTGTNTHYAWKGAAGQYLFGDSASEIVTATTRLDIRGISAGTVLRIADHSNNVIATVSNTGQVLWTSSTTFTATTQFFSVGSNSFSPSSGAGNYSHLVLNPTYNTTGTWAGILRGIHYNPTNTSLIGATHIGLEITTGQTRLPAVTQDNTKTQLLATDASTGQVFWVDKASISGGGITNSAANTELMMSNGTNAVPSGLFVPLAGNMNIGSVSISGNRTWNILSSTANAGLTINSQGTGTISILSSITTLQIASSSGVTIIKNPTSTNTIENVLNVIRTTSGVASAGIGGAIEYSVSYSGGFTPVGSIRMSLTDVSASYNSKYTLQLFSAGIAQNVMEVTHLGNTTLGDISGSYGGGGKVIFIPNATTNPSTSVTGGGVLFVKSSDSRPYWRTGSTESPMIGLSGTTGVTDNALLRADGTGASTVQGSSVTLQDNGVMIIADGAGGSITIDPVSSPFAIYSNDGNATRNFRFISQSGGVTANNAGNLLLESGNGYTGGGNGIGGHVFLQTGNGFGTGLDGSIGLFTTTASFGAGEKVLFIGNASAEPTSNPANGILLWAFDVAASAELKVRDEAGNVTTLSPHNFSLIKEPTEKMAWSYYSEKTVDNKKSKINVDMLAMIREVERLSGKKLVFQE